jgi:2-oxoglutarate ferredoxin oxidoreductase subunit alpha
MQEAVRQVRASGGRLSQLIIHSLWPVPETALRRALAGHERVIVPELNDGQYRLEVERLAFALDPRPQVAGLNRVDGELITPEQIVQAVDGRHG